MMTSEVKMQIPFFSFDKRNQDIRQETLDAFEAFLDSKWYVLGASTKEFEKNFGEYSEVSHAIGVSNGLDALHLSLLALGVGKGDEVIVPSNTYIATVLAVSFTGATPIFVEPKLTTSNLNPELLEQAITTNTKCIMPVHLYGQACEMNLIMEVARKHNLFIVEDNAQAHGARYKGKITGSFGHINATSFYPTKNLGALGEAGAITTDDPILAEKVSVLRNYGSRERYFNEVIGYNRRIDEFEASYLNVALKYINYWTQERKEIASWYNEKLSNKNVEVNPVEIAAGATSVYHLYILRVQRRDELRAYLQDKGIATQIHYPVPPHLQQAYAHLNYQKGTFPIAEELANTVISLPIYPGLRQDEVEYICSHILSFYGE